MFYDTSQLSKGLTFSINLIFLLMIVYLGGQFISMDALFLSPHDLSKLLNVVPSSFIHNDIVHLLTNALAIVVMILVLINKKQIKTPLLDIIAIGVASNLLVFVFGDPEYNYIGASNIVYGLAGYCLCSFILGKNIWMLLLIISLGLYLWPGLVYMSNNGVSYLSHYFGLFVGILLYGYRHFKLKNYFK